MHRTSIGVILIFLALSSSVAQAAEQNVILGVLEDVPGVYAGEPNSYRVRVLFQKNGENWQAFPSKCSDQSCLKIVSEQYPSKVAWTIAFDGRKLGKVTAQTPKEFKFYSHIGLQEVTGGSVPTIGKRSAEYSGFTDAQVYRPLVANSQPYFMDPESWKPSRLSTDVIRLLREEFRKKFPTVENCTNPDENIAKAWLYRNEDIKILKAYSSKNSWSVVRLQLAEYRCDGPADDAFIDQWFVVSPGRKVAFLDAGMWLVDAGDYDGDGNSELLFSIDRYNRGGYELFYEDFTKRATFEFGYH